MHIYSILFFRRRFLSNSPNPESAHQRYSSADRTSLQTSSNNSEQNRRLYTDRGVETVCQKYTDRSIGSPASADFGRYSGFPEVSNQTRYVSNNDRFNDLTLQRCSQSRSTDRFSTDRYMAGSSPAHDGRLSSAETPRYIVSSTERLLAPTSSSSSSSSETSEFIILISLKKIKLTKIFDSFYIKIFLLSA